MMKRHAHTLLVTIFCFSMSCTVTAYAQMEQVNPIERDANENRDDQNPISDLEQNTDNVTVPQASSPMQSNNDDDDALLNNSNNNTNFGNLGPTTQQQTPDRNQPQGRAPTQFNNSLPQDALEDFSPDNPTDDQGNLTDQLQPNTVQADEGVDLERNQDQDQDLAITPEMRDSELDIQDNVPVDAILDPTPNGAQRTIQPLENGTVTRQRVDGRGVTERTAGSREQTQPFDPLGLSVGSFYLFPSLDVSETFTDNVFISATRKASDATTIITPSLRLESNWDNHALELNVSGTSSHHAKYKTQDSKGLNVGLRGRIDVTNRTNILGGSSYSITQETGSSIDFNAASAAPSDIETSSYFAELNHQFNRLSLRLRGTREDTDFANGSTANGLTINNNDRDRSTHTVQSQLNYEFSPRLSVFLDNNFDWTNYTNAVDDNGINRDNKKKLHAVGVRAEITPFLNGVVRVGNQTIDPQDVRLQKHNAMVIDASLIWTPTQFTTVAGSYATTFSETTQAGSSATQSNQYQLTIQHQALENFTVNGGISLDTQTGLGNDNEITTYLTSLGTEYRMNRNIYLTSLFSYTDYNSNTLNADYEIKSATVGIRLQH